MKMVLNTTRSLTILLLLGAAGMLGGCHGDREDQPPRQFFPDMDDQPKWKPQEKSDFFTDGRTMRKPVSGTVAYGRHSFSTDPQAEGWESHAAEQREDVLKEDAGTYQGMTADGQDYLTTVPMPVTMDLLKLGQTKFNIYCSVCHGYLGDGKGTLQQYFAVAPANFHDPKFTEEDPTSPDPTSRDGYIFTIARNGVRSMPGYAHAINERETWAVVAYIRALQASRAGTMQDVPASQQPNVERDFGAPGSATTPANDPATKLTPADPATQGTPAKSNTPPSPEAGKPAPAGTLPPASPTPAPAPGGPQ